MIIQYIYISFFIMALVGAFYTIIIAFVNFIKMLGHVKPAPFFIKLTGLSPIMKKYLTDEGVRLRNKVFTYLLIFIGFWALGFSLGIQMNPDKWEKFKVEYNDFKDSPPSFPF